MLGIAVITYNRRERLEKVLDALGVHTVARHQVVVADDGSTDGSVEACNRRGVRVVTGHNRGVCWNKNRGLHALDELRCDPLLLMEDDIYPIADGWEADWVTATERWHHLAFAHPKIAPECIAGSGTPDDPYVNNKATAQCTSVSRKAMRKVGYLDTRFRGYGVGHAEWTTRMKRAGFGYKPVVLEDGRRAKGNLYLESTLHADDAPSFRDNDQVRANRDLFRRIKREHIYRKPWHDDDERAVFIQEQRDSRPGGATGVRARITGMIPPLDRLGRRR